MGVLGQSKDKGAAAVTPALQQPVDKTGFFQNVRAGFNEAVAGPHSTQVGTAIYQRRAYDQITSALQAEGEQGEDHLDILVGHPAVKRPFRNPYVSSPWENLTNSNYNPITSLYAGGDRNEIGQIWGAVQRVRKRKPDFLKQFPDEAALEAWTTRQRQADIARSEAVTSRASTMGSVGSFIGGAGGSVASLDPENAVGGGFATAAGKTFARTVIKRAVEGAGANAAASLVATPGHINDAQHLGQEMTPEDIAKQTGQAALIGTVFGGAHVLLPEVPGAVGRGVAAATDKAASIPPVRDFLVARSIAAGTISDHTMLNQWMRTHNPDGIVDTSSPDERAAAHVVARDAATREMSPLHNDAAPQNDHRFDALAQSLGVDLEGPRLPTSAPVQTPTVADRSASASSPRRTATFSDAINRAEGSTRNPRSSADGYGNFIDSTWLSVAPKVADTSGMTRAQILALRHDKDVAKRATDYYAAQNARQLHAQGLEDSPGNLSLAHFLGPDGASKLLKADPSTPVESLLPAKVIEANHEVLRGKSASEVVAWAHKRIGASVDQPPARADAVAEPFEEDAPYTRETFTPDELQTDAALMQYKSGGDENGITGKLKDVEQWNPLMSSEVLAWEGLDGRRIVVDGHQRAGLAKRLAAEGQNIELPALVLKEREGITAAQARTLGALRNINLGTGSLLDNARVLRDVPHAAEIIRSAEHRHEIEGLSRLSYEAFGAALNDVVDPRIASEVGKYAPDPSTHMALIGMLAKERIHNPREAGHIVRQAVADGFGSADEQQLGMFGDTPQHSLYVPAARIVAAASKRLRDEKRTFSILSDRAGRIEQAGNKLDRGANQSRALSAEEAIAILNATAHRAGPVRDSLLGAARAELSGVRRADAVDQFLNDLAGIDLQSAVAGAGERGAPVEPSGAEGSGDAAEAPVGDVAGSNGSLYDHALAARDAAERFSDPVGEGAKAQTALLEHDLRMDENSPTAGENSPTAENRQKQSAGENSPLSRENYSRPHLFDLPETGFRLSEEGEARTLKDILDEADADEAAAQAIRDCLK